MIECNSEERNLIASYLRGTSVPQLGKELIQGKYILKKTVINTVDSLGLLVTLTGEIPENCIRGSKKPTAPTTVINGDKKYLVKEQLPCMDGIDMNDGGHIKVIKNYISLFDAGKQLEMIITALRVKNSYLLVDGNKRTIAYYEHCKKTRKESIVFPIFILEVAT